MDALEKAVKAEFEANEKLSEVRHELTLLRIDAVMQRTEAGFAAVNARTDGLITSLSMERRMEQMEAIIASQNRDRLEGPGKTS